MKEGDCVIDYALSNLFRGSVDKQWTFRSDNYTLTNKDLDIESLSIQESMCETDEFKIGTYCSSQLKVKVLKTGNNERFVGERFSVTLVLDGHTENPFTFCDYTVVSDKMSSDHRSRELVMYDDLYRLSSIDVHSWYNNFIQEGHPKIIKEVRDGLFQYLSELDEPIIIEQDNTDLINDRLFIYHTANLNTMLASDLLKCILHINVCNCIINREGKLHYIYIPHQNPTVDVTIPALKYYNCHFEEYEVASFTDISVSETSSKSGVAWSGVTKGSSIKITGNLFLYKAWTASLEAVLTEIKNALRYSFNFTPFSLSCRGNPCVECGDIIEVTTDLRTFQSIIISRTINGLIGLVDEYRASSDEYIEQELDLGNISDATIGYVGNTPVEEVSSNTVELVTLLAEDWDGDNCQTVDVQNVSSIETEQLIHVTPTTADLQKYIDAQILAVEQYTGQIKFQCNTIPTNDINVYVAISTIGKVITNQNGGE